MQNNLHVIWHYNQKYFTKNKDIKWCHFDPTLIKVLSLSYYSVFVLHFLKSRICFLILFAFCSDGEIRQSEGFKNVNLGNVVTSKERSEIKANYVSMEDHELLESFKNPSFDVQVKHKRHFKQKNIFLFLTA